MILKLQRKFIIILMSVVTLILLGVFITLLLSTAGNARRMSETVLRQTLAPVQGFRQTPPERNQNHRTVPNGNPRISVLLAEIDEFGKISFRTNQFHFFDTEEAESIVRAALTDVSTTGVLKDRGLRWMKSDDSSRIAFTDIYMEQEMMKNLIINTVPVGTVALILFFFISILLSRRAVKPVKTAWEQQRQFVADASHELKTPLTVILSNAGMLRDCIVTDDDKITRRIDHIHAEAASMKKLVEDLLTLARSDMSEKPAIREQIDFSDIVTNSILIYEPIIFDEGKKLCCNINENLHVLGDANDLHQLLRILLDNACKYTPPGGLIDILLYTSDPKYVTLKVQNEGVPIPSAELENIFRRFYRMDKSRSDHTSFGLGLAIALSIAENHGGRIWAESLPHSANCFCLSLPLLKL